MGLDIYLHSAEKEVDVRNDEYFINEDIYFRKFNALFYWVHKHIKEVDNCEHIPVNREQLEYLSALLSKLNRDNCAELFPTCSGFFFGSQEYDEYYWSDVDELKKWVAKTLEDFDFDNEILYFFAWY